MRRIFLLLFTLLLGLSAVAQDEKYTINISILDSLDVSEVYLQKFTTDIASINNVVSDTIKIIDGKAELSGLLSDVAETPLAIFSGKDIEATILVFEADTITVNLGVLSSVQGTSLNDSLYAHRLFSSPLENQLKELSKEFTSGENLSDEEKQKIIDQVKPLSDQLYKQWFGFVKTNINNVLGQFFAQSLAEALQPNDLRELINEAPDSFKDEARLVARLAFIEEQEKAQGIGLPYKDITLTSPEGMKVSLSDYVGKKELVLIDFWASWCGPCIKEMPSLVKAYEQFKDKGFEIVGVSLDSSKEAWTAAIRRLNMTWVHISDLGGWQSRAALLYGVQSIPQTFLVNKEGKIVAANLKGEALISKIEELLNK